MALLPYGLRATMSAATWVDGTAQDLKLRLFFTSAPRAADRLADGRSTAADHVVNWAGARDIQVAGDAAALYQDWLKDVKLQAPELLAEQSDAVRFSSADLRRMVGNLPKDKGIPETLDELGESFLMADKTAIKKAIKRLQRYLASGQRPADLIDYQCRVRARHLLANDERLSAQLKGELYGVLLPLAFGSPLTYAGYCAVEECAGVPVHTSLRTALARSPAADPLAWILARDIRPGARSDRPLDELQQELRPTSAAEPLERVVRAVAAGQLRSVHGPAVLDFALRYLWRFGEPNAVLAHYGYLASVCEYIYRGDQAAQADTLAAILRGVFGAPLNRQAIDAVLNQTPTTALYKALLRMTARRDHVYVEKQTDAAVRRSQGLPNRPMIVRERRRWMPRWPAGRRRRGGREPVTEQSEFVQPLESPVDRILVGQPGAVTLPANRTQSPHARSRDSVTFAKGVWEHPRIAFGAVAVILVLCLIVYLMLQAVLR